MQAGAGLVVGTYLHGPLLALNPDLADALVKSALSNLEQADLNLKFTHVNAPIKGREIESSTLL